MTPKEIAQEIIWMGLEKKTGDSIANVYRVCMDIHNYIIDWAKKEKKERRGIMRARIKLYKPWLWGWEIKIFRGPSIISGQEFVSHKLAKQNAEKWFKKFGFEKWEG